MSPFTYSIKRGRGRILDMFSERVENLRGLSGGAQRDFNGSKSLWYDTLVYSPLCKSFKK